MCHLSLRMAFAVIIHCFFPRIPYSHGFFSPYPVILPVDDTLLDLSRSSVFVLRSWDTMTLQS
jgi:hypothetical protein